MRMCEVCGEGVTTLGGLQLHEAMAHSGAPNASVSRGPVDRREAPAVADAARPARVDVTVWVGAALLTAALVFVGITVVRHVPGTRATTFAAANTGTGSTDGAATSPAATDAMAAARQRYVAFANASNAETDNLKAQLGLVYDGSHTPYEIVQALSQAAALTAAQEQRLRAIPFPASIQPLVNAVLDDDAHIAAGLQAAAHGTTCAQICNAYRDAAPYFERLTQDVGALRTALGLSS